VYGFEEYQDVEAVETIQTVIPRRYQHSILAFRHPYQSDPEYAATQTTPRLWHGLYVHGFLRQR
jgi:hypothetical protein